MNMLKRFVARCLAALLWATRWIPALALTGAPFFVEFGMRDRTHMLLYPLVYAVAQLLFRALAPQAAEQLGQWTRSPRWLPSLVRNLGQAWAFFAIASVIILLLFDRSTFALVALLTTLSAVALWLLLTRSGRVALAATGI